MGFRGCISLVIVTGLFLCSPVFAGAPTVSNVQAFQRTTGGKEVVITYDLTDPDGDHCLVTVDVFDQTGQVLHPQIATGDFGSSIAPGTGKQVVCDVMREFPGRYGTTWRARVIANDGSGGSEELLYPLPGSTVALTFVRIPAGNFTMGSTVNSDEQPIHIVYLDEYWIMKYELTVAQWRVFVNATGRVMPQDPGFGGSYANYMTDPKFDSYPIVMVSYDDVTAFASWSGLKLPTEAQWEKAARGTDSRTYPWGPEEPEQPGQYRANITGMADGYQYTSPIATYFLGISPYGCFDMAGNVWEWCFDYYSSSYYSTPGVWSNPTGPTSGSVRVLRGGSWGDDAVTARCARRYNYTPSARYGFIGVRLARS